jgi:hypothetical protein
VGLELSVNTQADYSGLIQELLDGRAIPMDELK